MPAYRPLALAAISLLAVASAQLRARSAYDADLYRRDTYGSLYRRGAYDSLYERDLDAIYARDVDDLYRRDAEAEPMFGLDAGGRVLGDIAGSFMGGFDKFKDKGNENHLIERRAIDALYERDAEADLYERDAEADLYERYAEADLYERDAEADLYERDAEADPEAWEAFEV
jgi:hypothetical protein